MGRILSVGCIGGLAPQGEEWIVGAGWGRRGPLGVMLCLRQ